MSIWLLLVHAFVGFLFLNSASYYLPNSSVFFPFNAILLYYISFQIIQTFKSDSRLANNYLPLDIQKLRCRACYEGLRFAPQIEAMGKVISSKCSSDFWCGVALSPLCPMQWSLYNIYIYIYIFIYDVVVGWSDEILCPMQWPFHRCSKMIFTFVFLLTHLQCQCSAVLFIFFFLPSASNLSMEV